MLKKFCLMIFISIFLHPMILLSAEKLTFEILISTGNEFYIHLKNNTNKDIILPNNLRGCAVLNLIFLNNGKLIPSKAWRLANAKSSENPAWSSSQVFSISPGMSDDLLSSWFGPKPTQLVEDGDYYIISIIRDVPDSKEKIRVSNIVGFRSVKNWIQSPYQITRSEIPEAVLKNIDAEIDRIKQETPVSGDNQW